MKKLLVSVLAGTLALSIASCGTPNSGGGGEESNEPDSVVESTPKPSKEPAPVKKLEESGSIGDYQVEIHDFELSKDYSGVSAIIIGYTFTNNGDEAISGMVALSEIAYQNGVQLDTAIITEQDIGQDQMKDVKTGASIDLKSAFLLTSETAPVEFEISEFMSLSDERLGKTFQIADGGETVLSVAPSGSVSGTLGDYAVSVLSHKLSQDYEGNPAVVITFGFTNNGDDASNFMASIICKAFQDGVQLENAIITGDDGGNGESQARNVKPGAGTEVSAAYLLTSSTSPVELEIEEFMSFSDEKIETSIDIAG